MDEDRFSVVRDEAVRRRAANPGTRMLDLRELEAFDRSEPPSPEAAFRVAWPSLRDAFRTFGPGLLAAAVDQNGVAATAGLRARPDRPMSAIVGRHAATDLYLWDDATISLRHLVLLVLPRPDPTQPVRFRALDLRTGQGFGDEQGQTVQSLEADGPVFLRLGRYLVLLLPLTGERWPDDPRAAWARVPPRTWQHERRPLTEPGDNTLVQLTDGPGFPSEERVGRSTLGLLRVTSPRGSTALALSERSARNGVLLGRYDRCDNHGLRVLDDPNVSRVHLLIIEIDGALYAVDTGSTNGVRRGGERFREHALGGHDVLEIGKGLATVEWLAHH